MKRITNAEIYYLIGEPKPEAAELLFNALAQIEKLFEGMKGGRLPAGQAAQLAEILKAHSPGQHLDLLKRLSERRQSKNPAEWRNAEVSLQKAIAHTFTLTVHYRSALTNRKRKGTGEVRKKPKAPPPMP